jgi:phosphopantothenoylcysteine decarboxylase/phosphopantothenate--cysteine ligase
MVNASCNNLLLAVYLSSKCPVFIAPAMDLDMYKHPANKKNISKLIKYGNNILPVGEGYLASGLCGKGRMMEPELILQNIASFFLKKKPLLNKKILITAGPTYEPIDPVRFIGNKSSGKMGYELAREARNLGANVKLIIGPNSLDMKSFDGELINILTADEMFDEALLHFKNSDIFISAAAVSDFKPTFTEIKKMKKNTTFRNIELEPTKDILNELSKIKTNQILIGFALETNNEYENAKKKLKNKKLDAIILNSLNDESTGFDFDTNKITYIKKNGESIKFDLKTKKNVAKDIFKEIIKIKE